MSADFRSFVQAMLEAGLDKADQATSFMWWAEQHDGKPSVSIEEICFYFSDARLAQPNRTRLERDLRAVRYVLRDSEGRYQLGQDGIKKGNDLFASFHAKDTVEDFVSNIEIDRCPYIDDDDIADAHKMAEVYISLYCLENSIRMHVEKTLLMKLGVDWWAVAASDSMKQKEQHRRNNEAQNKWIPPRANAGPLYSLDWCDLVTLIRKHEVHFKDSIPDINFLHRFVDLGNLRNVVAHNGFIGEKMQFTRVQLAFHDWAKQIGG